MREKVVKVLEEGVRRLANGSRIPSDIAIFVDTPKEEEFGDFFTNLAMDAASRMRIPPRTVAGKLLEAIGDGEGLFEKVEVAGPGFINFFIRKTEWLTALSAVEAQSDRYGDCTIGAGKKVQVEFVSANPTGPLHVGHGRGAAVGDVLANLLSAAGYDVTKEYYINDTGRQIDLLARSVLARYRRALSAQAVFPEDGYRGEYILDIAKDLILKKGESLLSMDENDALTEAGEFAKESVLQGIRDDLSDFGVSFDHWSSEKELLAEHPLQELLDDLEKSGLAYRRENATWLSTTRFGDDKDRVLIRSNGQPTYFANDILYHREKYRREFDIVIDVWGADHHGYIDRMKAAVQALGNREKSIQVILIQLVRLLRGGAVVPMSTRQGEFVTLRAVIDEVGRDAARFFFVNRKADSKLDFDLELAVRKTSENPVYYVQYAHARIHSIFKKMSESGIKIPEADVSKFERLALPEELSLIKKVVLYPDILAGAAEALEPHRIPFYLQGLASRFHQYYNRHRVISSDEELTAARLLLIKLTGRVLSHGLSIIGVSAPESM